MELSEKAKGVIAAGSVKERVNRGEMFQQITFKVTTKTVANVSFIELYTDKAINTTELERISNLFGLPVEAAGLTSFPRGTSSLDFRKEQPADPETTA